MRRTRFIWLAIGIVIGLAAATLPAVFVPAKAEKLSYLKLQGPDLDRKDDLPVLKAVWACGARDFTTLLPTHSVEVAIPIIPANFKTIDCAIKAASGTDITVTISDKIF